VRFSALNPHEVGKQTLTKWGFGLLIFDFPIVKPKTHPAAFADALHRKVKIGRAQALKIIRIMRPTLRANRLTRLFWAICGNSIAPLVFI